MLPIRLSQCHNQERVIKRLSQLFNLASQRIVLPGEDYFISVPDKFDLEQLTREKYHSSSVSFALQRRASLNVRDQYIAEIRVYEHGENSVPGKRARGVLFLRYGVQSHFSTENLLEDSAEGVWCESSLAGVLRYLINMMNQTIDAHQQSLQQHDELPVAQVS